VVESHTRKTFTEEHLGKIVSLYPQALKISRDSDGKLKVQVPDELIGKNSLGIAEASQKRRTVFREALVSALKNNIEVKASELPEKGRKNQELKNTKTIGGGGKDSSEVSRILISSNFANTDRNKRKRKLAPGLKGLPVSLIEAVQQRKETEREMQPEAVKKRQRLSSKRSLPALFDLVYTHFRTMKRSKYNFDTLIHDLAQQRNNAAGWRSAVAQNHIKRELIKEQLECLLESIPEFCQLVDSKSVPGSKLFVVKLNGINISTTRKKLLM